MQQQLAPSQVEKYQPFEVEYHGPSKSKLGGGEVDFFLYVPHEGDIDKFLKAHPELKQSLGDDRKMITSICRMEADTFSRRIAKVAKEKLVAESYRVAIMDVLVPREFVDMNRVPEHALKLEAYWGKVVKIREKFEEYYRATMITRAQLITELGEKGMWIGTHTMRPFSTKADKEHNAPHKTIKQTREWCKRRLLGLKDPNLNLLRTTCLVAKNDKGEPVNNLALVQAAEDTFKARGVECNNSEVYQVKDHMLGGKRPEDYKNGAIIDADKRLACKEELGKDFDLENLTPDDEKIELLGTYFAEIFLRAVGDDEAVERLYKAA